MTTLTYQYNKETKRYDLFDPDGKFLGSTERKEIAQVAIGKKTFEDFEKITERQEDDSCPECGNKLITKYSGVKCSSCDWWFCY